MPRALQFPRGGAKPNKYRAQPVEIDGKRFASRKEGARYGELKMLERGGVIRDLETQPRFDFVIDGRPVLIRSEGFPNGRRASYRADFLYFDTATSEWIVEDTKSVATATEADKLRRALVECLFGVVVRTT